MELQPRLPVGKGWDSQLLFFSYDWKQVSCSAQCDLIGGKICPSGNCRGCACTHDTYDNSTNWMEEEEEEMRSGISCHTGQGSKLKFCQNSEYRCNFCKHPCCCNNHNCKNRKPAAWREQCANGNFQGNHKNINLLGIRHEGLMVRIRHKPH